MVANSYAQVNGMVPINFTVCILHSENQSEIVLSRNSCIDVEVSVRIHKQRIALVLPPACIVIRIWEIVGIVLAAWAWPVTLSAVYGRHQGETESKIAIRVSYAGDEICSDCFNPIWVDIGVLKLGKSCWIISDGQRDIFYCKIESSVNDIHRWFDNFKEKWGRTSCL